MDAMKYIKYLLVVGMVALTLVGCKKNEDTVDCVVSWNLYMVTKHTTPEVIENTFRSTFTNFWNNAPTDNSVRVTDISRSDVRSLALRLSQIADDKITENLDPNLGYDVTVKVIICFDNSYEEEIWSKTYRRGE